MTETCSTCRFFDKPTKGRANGECNRYPQPVVKAPAAWCGEWQHHDELEYLRKATETLVQKGFVVQQPAALEMREPHGVDAEATRDNTRVEGDDVT